MGIVDDLEQPRRVFHVSWRYALQHVTVEHLKIGREFFDPLLQHEEFLATPETFEQRFDDQANPEEHTAGLLYDSRVKVGCSGWIGRGNNFHLR